MCWRMCQMRALSEAITKAFRKVSLFYSSASLKFSLTMDSGERMICITISEGSGFCFNSSGFIKWTGTSTNGLFVHPSTPTPKSRKHSCNQQRGSMGRTSSGFKLCMLVWFSFSFSNQWVRARSGSQDI